MLNLIVQTGVNIGVDLEGKPYICGWMDSEGVFRNKSTFYSHSVALPLEKYVEKILETKKAGTHTLSFETNDFINIEE